MTFTPTTLVVGASGATGQLLVEQLLDRGQRVRAVVRAPERLPGALRARERLSLIEASLLELDDAELARHAAGCGAVASCLGHNLSLRGLFGPPLRLVTEATRRLCRAIAANDAATPTRFVLMNTAGNRNRDLAEPTSFAHSAVIGLLRLLLPPHADNEQAADYLRSAIGPDHRKVEWVVVRPDGLIDAQAVGGYDVHASPIRDAIFDAGTTSRINVAHFMAELISDDELWRRWRGRMPVIYDRAS